MTFFLNKQTREKSVSFLKNLIDTFIDTLVDVKNVFQNFLNVYRFQNHMNFLILKNSNENEISENEILFDEKNTFVSDSSEIDDDEF